MARNTLGDLSLHLFETLERLNDESLKGEELQEEMKRAKAISVISSQIISNANLVLKAKVLSQEANLYEKPLPKMLEG